MCIIVDANRLGGLLADPADLDVAPIRKWLDEEAGVLVYATGSRFADEIGHRHKRKLADYVRAGRARHIPEERFADDERALEQRRDRRSDDPHVLALARASGARLLCTGDNDLIADFKNKKFIDEPRGRIYSGAGNADLLSRSACAS